MTTAVLRSGVLLLITVLPLRLIKGVPQGNELGDVVFVNVLFRHGDRNIIKPYANDPNKNESNWPEGFGQLTNVGKQQTFELGQWLRTSYGFLLTDHYSRDVLYVRSTDMDRTLMSAKCVLAGMFPPKGVQVWNNRLNWQPIPTHTVPRVLDKIVPLASSCPAYEMELERVLNSQEIANLTEKYSDVIRILRENADENVTSIDDIFTIYEDLTIEGFHNLTVPDWALSIMPAMKEAAAYSFAFPTWTKKLARLKSGLLLEELINNLKEKRDQTSTLNVHIYSIHDSTIANLLNILGVLDLHIPPFTASVLMELRVDSGGNHLVTLFYRNSTLHEPTLLRVPGCTAACPLDLLINITRPVIPADWDSECQL